MLGAFTVNFVVKLFMMSFSKSSEKLFSGVWTIFEVEILDLVQYFVDEDDLGVIFWCRHIFGALLLFHHLRRLK